jgi:SAM-dependent methyltransferase
MKKLLTLFINYAINKAKRNKFVQNLFESPFDLDKFPKKGIYEDSYKNKYELLDGLRSKIRPNWERMLTSTKTALNGEYLSKQKSNGEIAVNKILPIIESLGKSVENSSILEVGCHSGASSFTLAELGASEVIGTEFSGYKVEAIDKNNKDLENKLLEVNTHLRSIRNELAKLFNNSNKVKFIDDDICNSTLTPSTFDIICSWEVLEHLHDTKKAFAFMAKLLKKGGIMIHEYNPFFCLNGGHSLCTLDMLWGHTQLNESDFADYLDKVRPNEKDRALSFYQKGLSRMTLHDLNIQLKEANLNVISILPFTKEQHLRMIDQKILERTQQHYPGATLLDLASPRIYVIAKKENGINVKQH